ncbi:impB/mucB/samB family protein [Microdochium trichocladiopsis]|uniref:DNA polymerase eta n=1 Tax=Microdochium trichocladiopsis TaxID=1682393 RepID=A0A9P8Y4K0_9PEZI|nr:impB/mucB/samB family protein [Microdochium trichocladiopsis]KAH7029447.1 impB/mucB/samB family protein [Microdochium trichocladiopsis]
MGSSPQFMASSPGYGTGRRKSQFTYRQLGLLASYSTSSPLRVIAHIDLDAFYAQCEMVRLGLPDDQPLAVQQWQGLIAVNYAARKFGIGRHCNVTEAKKLCPGLIAQHVATWKEGDEKWAYHDDAAAHIGTHKVSLDLYRLESRKILALIHDCLPANQQKVEKAGIDEVFVDLSAQIHSIMLQRFPELANPPPYDDPTEKLPLPPITALDWQADNLVDLDNADDEADDPDWDDVAILIGAELVRDIRAEVRAKLGYTCSAGIASNKMLSKLGSGFKKPNQQTVVRNRAVQQFLSGMKFTKIRNLGGKLGDQVAVRFETELIKDLLQVSLDQLKSKMGEDTGIWIYNTIRGIDTSEVTPRTQIKSMLSAKSFRPVINRQDQAVRWLRIFVADIFSRLVEEGVLENKRRPKTIHLQHRHGGLTKSRSSGIPLGKTIDETILFDLAKTLLNQIISEGHVWPCANLSLSVGGFEDGITGNMGIGAFLVKGDEARAANAVAGGPREGGAGVLPHDRMTKTGQRANGPDIQRFFRKETSSGEEPIDTSERGDGSDPHQELWLDEQGDTSAARPINVPISEETSVSCPRCNVKCEDEIALQSHQDWHFAKDLQEEERQATQQTARSQKPGTAAASSSATKRSNKSTGKLEQGQKRLKFG